MNKIKSWLTKVVAVHVLKRVVKKVWRQLPKEEKMEFLKSKEQIANVLAMLASVATALSAESVAAWLSGTAEAVAQGRLEVILSSVVLGVIALTKFLSRLNRKKEVQEVVAEVVAK